MPSLTSFIRTLQDVEYQRSANNLMKAIQALSGDTGGLRPLWDKLMDKAQKVEAAKLMSSPEYAMALGEFRSIMNQTETYVRQAAPQIELSGTRVGTQSFPAKMFGGTTQDMIEAGNNEEQVRMTYSVPERRQELMTDLTERKVLKWLTDKAKVTKRNINADEFYGRKSVILPK